MSTTRKAIYQNGALKLIEPIELDEGAEVDVVVFVTDPKNGNEVDSVSSWNALADLVDECAIDTGISDLANQHDHYLYGTPKSDS